MPATKNPATSDTHRAALAALKARIADKERRAADAADEIAAMRAERDRLHRDDAPASELAAHRTKLRDLEDEAEGLSGAVALLKRDVPALEAKIAMAEDVERADALEAAVTRGIAAYDRFAAALAPLRETVVPALFAELQEVGAEVKRAEQKRPPLGAGTVYNRVTRGHEGLLQVAQTIAGYTDPRAPRGTGGAGTADPDAPLALRSALTNDERVPDPLAFR